MDSSPREEVIFHFDFLLEKDEKDNKFKIVPTDRVFLFDNNLFD